MGWLLAVAAAFLFVHVVAAILCGHAARSETAKTAPETMCVSCD
jgi:hypothetical protein